METKLISVNEGTHGCVLEPPLPCAKSKAAPQSKSKSKSRTVGKILRIKNSEIELSIATIIKGIPGWERYYVISEEDNCSTKNFSKLRNQYAQQCKIYSSSNNDNLTQLLSPYAGTTVYRMGLTPSFDFVDSLRHMLEAVSGLEKQGLCHFDLHENNVLVDYKGTFRIIDFGSAYMGDQIDDKVLKRHLYDFSPQFPPQPPELSIQNGIYSGMTINDSLEKTMSEKRAFGLALRLLAMSKEEQERNLRSFWANDKTWNGDSWIPFFKAYWRKWDSWAIGVMFLNLLEKSFLLTTFIHGTWKKDGSRIRTVLKGLLQSNPTMRMTATEALDHLRGI